MHRHQRNCIRRLRSERRPCCRLIGVNRKQPAAPPNGAHDPRRTSDRSTSSGKLASALIANGPRHLILQFRKTFVAYPLVTSTKLVIRSCGVALSQGIRHGVRELGPASRTMVMVPIGLRARPDRTTPSQSPQSVKVVKLLGHGTSASRVSVHFLYQSKRSMSPVGPLLTFAYYAEMSASWR